MRTAILAALVLVAIAATVTAQYGPSSEERSAAVQQAITEAKAYAKQRQDARKAKAQEKSSGPVRITAKHYKQVSKEARRQGEARMMYEDMVHRAERKLAEMERKSHAQAQSADARAEELADELFHRPGSKLTQDELARMKTESDCVPKETPRCRTPTFYKFRTINGTCNNLDNPFLGAADTDFIRLIPGQYEDGISTLRGGLQARENTVLETTRFTAPNPSPRIISQTIIRNVSEDEMLTHILMQWGQFIDHDLGLGPELEDECPERGCEFTEICEPVHVPDRDPIFGVGTENNASCLPFSRSLPSCEDGTEEPSPSPFRAREQINVLTSFIDGSMVYGSDDEFANRLRAFKGGLLLEGENFPGDMPELPSITQEENRREDGDPFVGCPTEVCFLAGEFRVNEQVVLTVMHTLLFREHNRIARELAALNPRWGDERLYQETRRIVGALIQKITYQDYLPKILGKKVYDIVIGPYRGYNPLVDPGVPNSFATAAYRYGHTLIRPFFDRLDKNYNPIMAGPLPLLNAFMDPSQFRQSYGTDPILRGLVTQNSRRVDEFLSSALTNHLFRENLDLASLNIQRGRDHGIPPYIIWKNYCRTVFPNLPEAANLFDNELTFVRFLQLYGSLDTVDLWIGGLAEERLDGSLLGPTFACLFGIAFANVRNGDRFYYLARGQFEPDQLASIQSGSLSRMICDNSDHIDMIQPDAFYRQPRVPCSKIPSVDLTPWKESPCFFRVAVRRRSKSLGLRSYSRAYQEQYSFFPVKVPGSKSRRFVCMPVVCPDPKVPTDVIFYGIVKYESVLLVKNSNLPESTVDNPEVYKALWPASLFEDGGAGLFKTRSACRASSEVAFTVGLKSVVNIEQNLALTPQNTTDTGDPNSPSANEETPSDILQLLLAPNPLSRSALSAKTADAVVHSESESEAQLMSDLEDALKALNV